MVVMFLPGDPILEAAARANPEIFDYAYSRNVVLVTPSSLIALLRAVAPGWQQQSITDEAKTIHALGKELAGRLKGVLSQLDRLGASLGKAVDSYNATVGTVENRLGVTVRKLSELHTSSRRTRPSSPADTAEIRQTSARAASQTRAGHRHRHWITGKHPPTRYR